MFPIDFFFISTEPRHPYNFLSSILFCVTRAFSRSLTLPTAANHPPFSSHPLRERQGKLEGTDGFEQFVLLKKCEYKHNRRRQQAALESITPQQPREEYVEYLGQSSWAHELDYISYIESIDVQQRLPPGLSSFLVAGEQPKDDPTGYIMVLSEPSALPEKIGGR